MSSLSNVNFAPYSSGGQNLKKALGVNALTRNRQSNGVLGGGSDMLNKSLMDRENKRVETSPAITNPLQNKTKSANVGLGSLEQGVQKTVLGGKIGTIVSKLI